MNHCLVSHVNKSEKQEPSGPFFEGKLVISIKNSKKSCPFIQEICSQILVLKKIVHIFSYKNFHCISVYSNSLIQPQFLLLIS